MKTATYLYCVVRAEKKPDAAGAPPGVSGGDPPSVSPVATPLWLVSASVPLDVYGAGSLEPRLRDFEWVGRTAVAHEAVVEHFAQLEHATIVPLKMFTLFSTLDRAVADIASRRAVIEAVMNRIAGAEEWGVRVIRTATPAPAAAPSPKSGAAFLAAKKERRDKTRHAKLAAAEATAAAFDRLAALARDARRREATPMPAGATPLLDAAFLVSLKQRGKFKEAARHEAQTCAAAGAQLTLSGPWPAYNFVQMDGGQ